ncbi:uncharacterized protein N7515_007962 [Penicillium bovifimosum]|uniref:Uncharacterized protein n=1 Tax=Penicillium bovifimosum TaxID=126998 RepID=A0A9W9KX20_9EURO|nr:uncharacterized protein N7515_007962 [Penicillium bovifimosum]KAJ5124137.1 hypothetical protein N7515_007962 [Penicillium bovifimosum]
MSELTNPDSITHKQGPIHPSVEPQGPGRAQGHKPGQHKPGTKLSELDQRQTYHMEGFPPGTAPASNSFTANPISEGGSQALNPNVEAGPDKEATYTSVSDTLHGSTSADLNRGIGKPMQGQTSTEMRHDGQHGRKNPGRSVDAYGPNALKPEMERRYPDQRAMEREAPLERHEDLYKTRVQKHSRLDDEPQGEYA